MLENVDLGLTLKKKEWKQQRPALQRRLYDLGQATYEAGVPVIILFEGWDASGKGSTINDLTQRLDPRGFKVWPIRAARTYEKARPWLWRFWLKLPNRGQIAIFDRSWYGRVLVERIEGLIDEPEWRKAYRDIVDFERTLADDGHIIIKFWMHISKAEQRKRFKMLEKDPLTAWHVQPEDWRHHKQYDKYVQAVEEMFENTETEWGPWTIVEATSQPHTFWKAYTTIITALEKGLRLRGINPDQIGVDAAAPDANVSETEDRAGYEPTEITSLVDALADVPEGFDAEHSQDEAS